MVIVLPLREGARQEAEGLLTTGPPFDVEGCGVERFRAFLSDREAIITLEGCKTRLEKVPWDDLSAWGDGARWERCAAGPPRLATRCFAWSRAPEDEGLFFGPDPGPGDSEGGPPWFRAEERTR